MKSSRKNGMRLDSPQQQEVLTSPVRIEIIERMQGSEPSSIGDIARRMGRSAASLYHHFRKLLAAGVLIEEGRRRAGRRWEALYRLAAPRFHMDLDQSSQRNVRCYRQSAGALLRLTERNFADALELGELVSSGRYRNLVANLKKARLSKTGLARVNRLLQEIHDVMREEDARGTGQPCALTTVLLPLLDTTQRNKESK
ncbi:MAG: helix-turn-helix transcriptional regulator [Phycisphaerales bacterium]|nr:MAG: helix-turn-helix transcriptional regulator [Phycisphaerales bacterium]